MNWFRKLFGRLTPINKRQYVRVKTDGVFKQIAYGLDKYRKVTTIHDISEGGLRIASSEQFDPNDVIQFVIDLPKKKWELFALGKVVWSKKLRDKTNIFHSGIRIIEMEDDDASRLRAYIREVIKQPVIS